jgi:hypothetical protein
MMPIRTKDLIRRLVVIPERQAAAEAADAERQRRKTDMEKARKMTNVATNARKLKITAVLENAPFVQMGVPPDNAPPRTTVTVSVGARTLVADLATNSVRKAIKTLMEHGPGNVVLVLQGALGAGDVVDEAGIVAQVKAQEAAGEKAAP